VPRNTVFKIGAATAATAVGVILAISSVSAHPTQAAPASTLHATSVSVTGNVVTWARQKEAAVKAAALLAAQKKEAAELAAKAAKQKAHAAALAAKAKAEAAALAAKPVCTAADRAEATALRAAKKAEAAAVKALAKAKAAAATPGTNAAAEAAAVAAAQAALTAADAAVAAAETAAGNAGTLEADCVKDPKLFSTCHKHGLGTARTFASRHDHHHYY
jgi:hypothetical protein